MYLEKYVLFQSAKILQQVVCVQNKSCKNIVFIIFLELS